MTDIRLNPAATRLGNWMFQYAAAKCANGGGPVRFVIPSEQAKWAGAVEKYRALWGETPIVAEGSSGVRASDVRIGLYQDAKYVDRATARALFLGPLNEHLRASRTGSVPGGDGKVSIHVRRGDYLRLPHRHPFVGAAYLREAVARFPDAEFLVFSDDLAWCRRFFRGPRFQFAEGNDVLTDLALMTRCGRGHVCSNSTFSWWGAYLGDDAARTVFPSQWFGLALRHEDWRGLYFPGSEVVRNGYTPGLRLHAVAMMAKNACGNALRRLGLR